MSLSEDQIIDFLEEISGKLDTIIGHMLMIQEDFAKAELKAKAKAA